MLGAGARPSAFLKKPLPVGLLTPAAAQPHIDLSIAIKESNLF